MNDDDLNRLSPEQLQAYLDRISEQRRRRTADAHHSTASIPLGDGRSGRYDNDKRNLDGRYISQQRRRVPTSDNTLDVACHCGASTKRFTPAEVAAGVDWRCNKLACRFPDPEARIAYEQESRRSRLRSNRSARLAAPIDGSETWHGTTNGYGGHGCRCSACTAANSADQAARRAANRSTLPPHEIQRIEKISEAARERQRTEDGKFARGPSGIPFFGDVIRHIWTSEENDDYG